MGYVWNLYSIQEATNNQSLFGCNCSASEDLLTGMCTVLVDANRNSVGGGY